MENPLNIENIFNQSDFFKVISKGYVADILKVGTIRNLKTNDILFHQGDPATRIYLVLKGQLKLTKLHEAGKEAIIRYICPGELMAAVTVLKKGEYLVTAEVVSETKVIGWGRQTILDIMNRYPQIVINMLCIVLEQIDDMQCRYLELSAEHAEQRIARSLLRIMQYVGQKSQDGIHVNFPITRKDLAEYTGTTF
jgi:CRP/FNR family transcriptional regulator, nitrogen oxide reductase regulator